MKYIVEFEDEPCMYEDDVHFYKCIQAPWWGLSEKVIKQLTPYQPDAPDTNVGNITNLCAHENDPISRQMAIDTIMGQPPEPHYPSWYAAQIEKLPAAQPDHNADISEINKFIDGLEEILADIRERHVDDSVCGLCEYDGAYMDQSGDWCNECPGFDKDDCFKLSDETRKKWIEEIVNTYPDHNADIGKKASISDNHENDCISRQAAIDIVRDKCKRIPTCAILAMDAIAKLPVALPEPKSPQNGSFDFEQPEIKSDRTTDDCISREAAIDALDEQIEQCNKALCSFDISPKDEYAIKVERASLEAYKEQLENMPSAQSEQRWIPVTERLTENDNEVLITVWDAEDDYVEVYKGFYQGHEWWTQWCHGCSKIKDEPCGENIVIAWMPLPEPYRGGEKE